MYIFHNFMELFLYLRNLLFQNFDLRSILDSYFFKSIFIVFAIFCNFTIFTFWISRRTMISSKKNKRMMEPFFYINIEEQFYFSISCFRGFSFHYSETVHHPMNMSINTNIRAIIEYCENYFGSFNSDSWKCLNKTEIIRNDSIVFTS